MRVLYFSLDYTTHDRRFLLKLAETPDLSVYFLRLENDRIPSEARDLPDGVTPVGWQGGRETHKGPEAWLRWMPEFEKVIDDVHPDLIHAGPIQSCAFMTALTGFHPFLAVSWGFDLLVDAHRDGLWRWMARYALERSDMLFCDCDAVRRRAQSIAPYADERIVQFPWGIDLRRFAPGPRSRVLRSRPGWEQAFVILSTRAWEPVYGIEVLLEAFRLARMQNPRLRLALLGAGSLASRVAGFIGEHGLAEVVACPGMVGHEALPEYFRAADAYVSCTYNDGTSISLLEAMATGLPVVVTDVPGNREWVRPVENGWLAGPGNVGAFASAMVAASQLSPDDRARMVVNNRGVTKARADWETNFSKLLEAYGRMVGRHVS